MVMNEKMKSKNEKGHYSSEEVGALWDQMEEENKAVVEVLRVKRLPEKSRFESDGMPCESSRKLQLMTSLAEILKAVKLENAVDSLQMQNSKLVRDLIEKMINELKNIKEEWHESTHQYSGSEVSHDAAIDEEWGLPCSPLDEGAFLMSETSPVDLSKFFEGIDDNGNVQVTEEPTQNLKQEKQPQGKGKGKEMRILKRTLNQTEPSHVDSKPSGHTKLISDHKVNKETENQKEAKNVSTKKAMGGLEDLHSNEAPLHLKFECTKRKLHDAYKQVENAKKQRRIQFVDFQNLPRERNCHRNLHLGPKKFFQRPAVCHH